MDLLVHLSSGLPVDVESLLQRISPDGEWSAPHYGTGGANAVMAQNVFENRRESLSIGFESACGVQARISYSTWRWGSVLDVKFGDREISVEELDSLATLGGHAGWYPPALGQARDSEVLRNAGGPRHASRCLSGVGELHWFGSDLVEFMGGDDVFAALPDGWAEKTEFGQWRVVGLDHTETPEGFNKRAWSTRERAVIERLGREFFADMDTQTVPKTEIPIPDAPYDIYLWSDNGSELLIVSPDGSSRPIDPQSVSAPETEKPVVAEVMASRAELFESEMAGRPLGEMIVNPDEDSVYWVGEWVGGQSMFDAGSAVKLVGAWLGQQVVGRVDGVQWSDEADPPVLTAGEMTFDPFGAVQQWIAGEDGAPRLPAFVATVRRATEVR